MSSPPCHYCFFLLLFFFFFPARAFSSSCPEDGSSESEPLSLGRCDALLWCPSPLPWLLLCAIWEVKFTAASRLPLSITISFSHPFSRRRSAASRSRSSARPVKSETERSRFVVRCFFLIRNRARNSFLSASTTSWEEQGNRYQKLQYFCDASLLH